MINQIKMSQYMRLVIYNTHIHTIEWKIVRDRSIDEQFMAQWFTSLFISTDSRINQAYEEERERETDTGEVISNHYLQSPFENWHFK